ncbi:uncharacterized protein MELLADRAFT_77794 [Melampsora larici-populina 98AG31]|uniref:F-box domain-containing protein n=1 Tax=Melampsora larici-populina (strain 98AG31 / pathotype 3-4-7) TaxID=747676 RepID=F4RM04_MELLP|nr:uncharacterized protein MELLADRAFT_77794 [Melampsora larici-populina 98AG31]EGG06673.1 hypothetical protein MELLADRAFT_77794 [Melampsora larici-populina 98AG31]
MIITTEHQKISPFLNLPIEILARIINYLEKISLKEVDELHQLKFARATRTRQFLNGRFRHYYSALNDSEPILTSLQSLACVNRSMEKLCRTWLWKTIKFPSSLPVPIDTWTEGILPKYGESVQSLSIYLSVHCLMSPSKVSKSTLYDNTIRCPNDCDKPTIKDIKSRIAKLNPVSVIRIIMQCPNLQILAINLPDKPTPYQPEDVKRLENLLIPLVIRLPHLKRLNIMSSSDVSYREEIASSLVSKIPTLQSFSFLGRPGNPIPSSSALRAPESLSYQLSKLEHLNELELALPHFVDSRWISHTWPTKLVDLKLILCENLSLNDLYKFIKFFAPTLECLSIAVGLRHLDNLMHMNQDGFETDSDGEDDIFNSENDEGIHLNDQYLNHGSSWAENHRLDLPRLTQLTLFDAKPYGLLKSFQDCKDITWLVCCQPDWTLIEKLVNSRTWPCLRFLGLETKDVLFSRYSERNEPTMASEQQALFADSCRKAGIQLKVMQNFKMK